MKLGEICSRPVLTIDRGALPQQAALLMREHHVGALVLTDQDAQGLHVVGIVTDRDLALAVVAQGAAAMQRALGEIGNTRLVSAPADADLAAAVALMREAGVRRLLVQGADQRLVGLVSFDDLLAHAVAPLAGLAEVLRQGLANEAGANPAPPAPVAVRVPAMGTAGWAPR